MPEFFLEQYTSVVEALHKSGTMRETIARLISGANQKIKILKHAYERGELKRVQEILHTLSGTMSLYGGRRCVTLCIKAQEAIATTNHPPDQKLMDDLVTSIESFCKRWQTTCAQLEAAAGPT
jgi:HPt (histidine-containing phosphotransfer) domain-containing protein